MPSLRISEQQVTALSDDVVRRHALGLQQRVDSGIEADQPAPAGLPPAAARLKSLLAVLRSDLQQKAGPAAPFLAVDLEVCARQWLRALQAGAAYRDAAAAALMSAASALGASWLGDERLCVDGEQEVPALADPVEAADLLQWAETSWAGRYRFASKRSQALQLPLRYAMAQVIEVGSFDAQALRSIADVVFDTADEDRLRRFLTTERGLIAAAGLDARTIGDRQIEATCMAGDMAFGLGRFVRMAVAARASGQAASGDALQAHLRKALDALAE